MRKHYIYSILACVLLISSHVQAQTGPGGVGTTDGTSNLKLWLNAAVGTSTTTNGVGVSTWNDQSGNGYHVTQGTGGNQPTYVSSSINGQPALSFNGTSSTLSVSGFPLFATNASAVTQFIVFNPTDLSGQKFLLLHGGHTNCSNNFELGYRTGSSSTPNWGLHSGCSNAAVAENAANTAYNILTLKVLSSGTSPSNVKISKNGTAQSVVNNFSGWASAGNYGTASNTLFIGSRNGGDGFHSGPIAEIISYNQALNSAETVLVENYLNAKYNLTVASDKYAQPSATTYIKGVAGIGKESDGTSTSSSSKGLTIANSSYLTDNGDYLMFGYDNSATTTTTANLTAAYSARWTRDWFIDKTDVSSNNGNTTLTFDFSEMGIGGTPSGLYALIYRSTGSGDYSEVSSSSSISGDQVSFTVNTSSIADGYYTLGYGNLPLGNALNFDGTGDHVLIPANSDFNFTTGTVEAWIKPGVSSSNQGFLMIRTSTGTMRWSAHINQNNGSIGIYNGVSYSSISVGTLSAGTWYHVAIELNGTSCKIYVNGILKGSTGNGVVSSTTGVPLSIGNSDASYSSEDFLGEIDDVRIWNVARTQSEIQNNMYTYYTGSMTNLKAYYRFDQGNASTTNTGLNKLIDYSGNCNTGTLTNFALTGATSNWVSTGNAEAPILTTTAATSVSASATLNANIFSTGESSATTRGFCYATSQCPTIANSVVNQSGAYGTGTYSLNAVGLLPLTTYYVRAYATNAQGTSYGEEVSFTTLATPIWSAGAWSSTPTASDNAVINDTYNAAGFACNNLTVNAGKKLTIASGTLAVGGNLTLKSDASGTATLLNNGTVTVVGSSNVEQYLSTARNWYVSSPLSSGTAPAGYSYFQYNEPGDNLDLSGQATAYWKNVSVASPLTVGRGYVAVLASAPATINFTGGTLNSANKTLSLTRTSGKDKEGFNLVGNPYPSYLDITDLKLNSNIESSFWIRSKTTNYVFDTYNLASDVATTNSGLVTTSKIPPMQAFWLRVVNGNVTASVTLEESKRMHQDVAQNKFRAPSTQKLVRLQVSNGTIGDEAVIYFNANAADGYDRYDSPKMSNNVTAIPEIYTLVGNEQVAINGLNEMGTSKTLTLGFKAGETATYSIKATQVSNFDTDTRIVLKDMLLNTEHELTQGEVYTFTSGATNSSSRFNVIFKSAGVATGLDSKAGNSVVNIYRNVNNQIIIDRNDSLNQEGTIKVYNALGQILNSVNTTGARTLMNNSFGSGVYLVTLQLGEKLTTRKVVLK